MVRPVLAGIGSASPPSVPQTDLWDSFFEDHFDGDRRARMVWRSAGVRSRGAVADPRVEDLRYWGTEARMRRFIAEAMPLAKEASARALEVSRADPEGIDFLVAVSCTGYANPGLDVLLARDMALPPTAQRIHVGHMGCFAALPALAAASDAAVARGATTLVTCAELSSLHMQPPTRELDQILAHALFGDAVAAAVVRPGGAGLEVLGSASRTDPSGADLMGWDVTDRGFRMRLSPDLPRALRHHVSSLVRELLDPHGLAPADVTGWAIHPGGPRVVRVVGGELQLGTEALAPSLRVLSEHGNCSSATVLLILEQLMSGVRPGDHVVALAFGPGLTLAATLLRAVGA